MSKAELTLISCPHCGASTPLAGDFCAMCGAPNEVGQTAAAAMESVLAKHRLPENTRAIDLTPETMSAFRSAKLGPLVQAGNACGIQVVDLEVGNVGGHAGQFVATTVKMPSDPSRRTEVRDTAIGLMLYAFAGDPDTVSVRVVFLDDRGLEVARAVTDTTDCTQEMTNDDRVMAQYSRAHSRIQERDQKPSMRWPGED
jgi:hypothetical protein